jgi:hypothetical protein
MAILSDGALEQLIVDLKMKQQVAADIAAAEVAVDQKAPVQGFGAVDPAAGGEGQPIPAPNQVFGFNAQPLKVKKYQYADPEPYHGGGSKHFFELHDEVPSVLQLCRLLQFCNLSVDGHNFKKMPDDLKKFFVEE